MSMKNPIVRLALGLAFAAGLAGCASQPSSKEIAQKNLLASGENAELHGDYDQALVQYVQLLGEDPENVDAHYRIGRVHAAIGNGSIAREAFSRVLGWDCCTSKRASTTPLPQCCTRPWRRIRSAGARTTALACSQT
jgi:hypothetical protein